MSPEQVETYKAEIERLQKSACAWKQAAKAHRANERRKQKNLEWGVTELDRLQAEVTRWQDRARLYHNHLVMLQRDTEAVVQ